MLIMTGPYYSQFQQDKYIFENFLSKTQNGVFVDIGADDGERFSNSYFFERNGYTGLCIEPRKSAFDKLIKIRNCYCENVAVDTETGSAKFLQLDGYGSGLSGIVKNYDPRHVTRISREIKHKDHKGTSHITVKTELLQDLLDRYQLFDIDLLSMDIEGHEFEILKTIDWDKINIKVITVENNYKEPYIRNFLESKGYKFKTRLVCDEIYYKDN